MLSFLSHGHEYHLYTYAAVEGVPSGIVIKDARRILPESMIFEYKEHRSVSGFSNFFRYKLLLETGGWWVDTDVVCLKTFDFADEYVFASERDQIGREKVTSGIMKAPRGAKVMEKAWDVCRSKAKAVHKLRWGETGPELMQRLVSKCRLSMYVKTADVFCPIDPMRFWEVVVPKTSSRITSQTYSVHLWNEMWRRLELDKDEVFAPRSLYESVKRTYL